MNCVIRRLNECEYNVHSVEIVIRLWIAFEAAHH